MVTTTLPKKSKTHIVHIIPTLRRGGAERLVVDLTRGLVRDGYEVTVITFFSSEKDLVLKSELAPGVHHMVVQKKGKLSFSLVKKIERTLKECGADIVHTHLFGGDWWGRRAAKKLGLPVVTTEHGPNHNESWIKHTIRNHSQKDTDIYVAVSGGVKEYLKNVCNITGKILVIHPGIQTGRFTGIKLPRLVEPLKILMIGRLAHEKGFDVGISALAKIVEFPWTARIVGEGVEAENLLRLINKEKLESRISIEHGTNAVEEVYEWADVVIVPSRWEGFGLVPLEARAAGRIVIGTRTGGMSELILDKKNGFLIDPGSAEQLTAALRWIFEHTDVAKKMARTARVDAVKSGDIAHMIHEYEIVYESLV